MKKSEIANEQPNAKVIVLVLVLALLWGGNSVSIKISLQDIPPLALAGMRFLLGMVAITVWSLFQCVRIRMKQGELFPLLVLSGIFLVQIIALNVGTENTTASRSTIFVSTYPFFTALFAHFWVPGDRLSIGKTVGILIAFSGILLTFVENSQPGERESPFGDLVVLTSGGVVGLRVVVTKRLVQSIHPYRLLVWMMTFCSPCFFVLSFFLENGASYRFSISGLVAIFYQGLVVAGFCFVAWTSVLEKYSPSKLVVLFFTTPLFGVLLSYLLLGDEMNLSLIAGVGLVAYGIYLVNKRGRDLR